MSEKQLFIIWSDDGLGELELLGMLEDSDSEQDFSVCDIKNSIDAVPDTPDYKAIVEELVNCGLVSQEDIEKIKADTLTDNSNSSEERAS